jgi:hypothetical protein
VIVEKEVNDLLRSVCPLSCVGYIKQDMWVNILAVVANLVKGHQKDVDNPYSSLIDLLSISDPTMENDERFLLELYKNHVN